MAIDKELGSINIILHLRSFNHIAVVCGACNRRLPDGTVTYKGSISTEISKW